MGDSVSIIVNIGLFITYILLGGGVLLTLGGSILFVVTHPKKGKDTLIGVGGLLVMFLLGYIISGGEVTDLYIKNNVASSGLSKFLGGSLIAMYLLGFGAIASILYSEIVRLFK